LLVDDVYTQGFSVDVLKLGYLSLGLYVLLVMSLDGLIVLLNILYSPGMGQSGCCDLDSAMLPAGVYLTNNNQPALRPKTMSQSTQPLDDSRLLTSFPTELLSNILESIKAKPDLLNLGITCKLSSRSAKQVLWVVCSAKGYAKLLKMDIQEQDIFARWIRDQTITFEENGFRPAELTLYLPELRVLRIMHCSNDPIGKVEISRMITESIYSNQVT
jgi:hypothetical protein